MSLTATPYAPSAVPSGWQPQHLPRRSLLMASLRVFRFSPLTWRLGDLTGGDIANSYVLNV